MGLDRRTRVGASHGSYVWIISLRVVQRSGQFSLAGSTRNSLANVMIDDIDTHSSSVAFLHRLL